MKVQRIVWDEASFSVGNDSAACVTTLPARDVRSTLDEEFQRHEHHLVRCFVR